MTAPICRASTRLTGRVRLTAGRFAERWQPEPRPRGRRDPDPCRAPPLSVPTGPPTAGMLRRSGRLEAATRSTASTPPTVRRSSRSPSVEMRTTSRPLRWATGCCSFPAPTSSSPSWVQAVGRHRPPRAPQGETCLAALRFELDRRFQYQSSVGTVTVTMHYTFRGQDNERSTIGPVTIQRSSSHCYRHDVLLVSYRLQHPSRRPRIR